MPIAIPIDEKLNRFCSLLFGITVRVSILGHAHAHAVLKLIKRLESEALGTHMCTTMDSGG